MNGNTGAVHHVVNGMTDGTAYGISGAGDAVVLIHGVGMQRAIWAPQVNALAPVFRVIAYDMLGHGESDLPPVSPSLNDYAEQLLRLLDHLGVGKAIVIGHSMGALVALEFALRHPGRVLGVAALNGVYERTPAQRAAVMQRAASLEGLLIDASGIDATMARWFDEPVPPHLSAAAAQVRALLASVNEVGYARTYQLFARSDRAHVERLPQLAVPALFMTGTDDQNSSPMMSEAMARAAPLGTVTLLPNARHMMNVTAPDLVNQRLLAFIQEVVGVS